MINTTTPASTHTLPRDAVAILIKIVALVLAMPSIAVLSLSLVNGFDSQLVWLYLALATVVALSAGLFFRSYDVGGRTTVLLSLAGAVVLGAIGFVAGFWYPGLFRSHGNLAPLVGVFVTGPIGVVCGALVGLALGICRKIVNKNRTEV